MSLRALLFASLAWVVYPAWLVAGFIDYVLHRRTGIERTTGARESWLHLAQFASLAVALSAAAYFAITPLLLTVLTACVLLHTVLAFADVSYTTGRRYISPLEQHVHGVMTVLPLVAVGLVAVLGWAELWSTGWVLRRGSLGARDAGILVGSFVLLAGLPIAEELVRSSRVRSGREDLNPMPTSVGRRHRAEAGGSMLSGESREQQRGADMERIEKTVEVDCPVRTVYNQWTQFEDFPRFMAGVEEVRQLDDTHLRWKAKVWGKEQSWDSEITEQTPDERISWRSIDGAKSAGTVRFEPLGTGRTRVRLAMAYEPEGAVENAGELIGAMDSQVESSVEDFKKFIEGRGQETGAWRGKVRDSEPR